MEQPPTRPESERLLSLATYFLSHRDLKNSREHALAAHRSDPDVSGPDQIVAVTNVLLAADRRLPNHQLDWYSILQITRPGTRPEMEIRFRRLVSLLNPLQQSKVPFSQDAFKLVCDAWSVLSDPEKKTQYDNEINNGNENLNGDNPQKPEEKTQESGENEGGGTFWTVCPYCYYMYMYEKVYEECCLRCQNCRRAFHGVAVEEGVTESVVVEGKEEYFCGFGFFQLGYKGGGGGVEFDGCGDNLGDKKAEFGDKSGSGGVDGGWDNVVQISDDSGEEKGVNVKSGVRVEEAQEEGVKGGGEKVEVRNDGKRVMKNVKSVPRNSKKIMGKGVKCRRTERVTGRRVRGVGKGDGGNGNGTRAGSGGGSGNGNGGDCFEEEMEFFEGDDDFFV